MGAEQSRERDGLPPLEAQSPNVVHGGQTQNVLQALARLEAEAGLRGGRLLRRLVLHAVQHGADAPPARSA